MLTRCLVLVLVVAGCKKDPGPSCDKIADHMLEVTKQAMPGHDPSLLGNRKDLVDGCEKRNLPRDVRVCMMNAKTLADLGACQPKRPQPQPTRPLPTTPAETPTTTPPPAGTETPKPAVPDPTPPPPVAPSGTSG